MCYKSSVSMYILPIFMSGELVLGKLEGVGWYVVVI